MSESNIRKMLNSVADGIEEYVDNKLKEEYEVFGWMFWDKDVEDGFDDAIFVFGRENPADSEQEQIDRKGDHQGHIWDSMPLYRQVGKLNK